MAREDVMVRVVSAIERLRAEHSAHEGCDIAVVLAALAAAEAERDQAQQITESWYRQYQVTSAALAAAEQRATRLAALEQAARAWRADDTVEAESMFWDAVADLAAPSGEGA